MMSVVARVKLCAYYSVFFSTLCSCYGFLDGCYVVARVLLRVKVYREKSVQDFSFYNYDIIKM